MSDTICYYNESIDDFEEISVSLFFERATKFSSRGANAYSVDYTSRKKRLIEMVSSGETLSNSMRCSRVSKTLLLSFMDDVDFSIAFSCAKETGAAKNKLKEHERQQYLLIAHTNTCD